MCRNEKLGSLKLVGGAAVCFGMGLLLSFLLPAPFLAFLGSAVVVTVGVLLLLKKS